MWLRFGRSSPTHHRASPRGVCACRDGRAEGRQGCGKDEYADGQAVYRVGSAAPRRRQPDPEQRYDRASAGEDPGRRPERRAGGEATRYGVRLPPSCDPVRRIAAVNESRSTRARRGKCHRARSLRRDSLATGQRCSSGAEAMSRARARPRVQRRRPGSSRQATARRTGNGSGHRAERGNGPIRARGSRA